MHMVCRFSSYFIHMAKRVYNLRTSFVLCSLSQCYPYHVLLWYVGWLAKGNEVVMVFIATYKVYIWRIDFLCLLYKYWIKCSCVGFTGKCAAEGTIFIAWTWSDLIKFIEFYWTVKQVLYFICIYVRCVWLWLGARVYWCSSHCWLSSNIYSIQTI